MSFTSMNTKRQPTSPEDAASKKTQSASSSQTGNSERDKKTTVFNSNLDKKLITVDAYEDQLGKTMNNLYDFSTTMDFGSLGELLQGGLGMLGRVTSALGEAKQIKDALQSGNIMDALGRIAPGAKSILAKAGIDASMVDKFVGVAQIAVNVNGVVQNVKAGNVDILSGINDLAKAVTGTDLSVITDIQAMITAGTAIADEFTKAGIALGDSWNNLVGKNGLSYGNEVFHNTYPSWSSTGDYSTIKAAINHLNPEDLEQVTGNVSESLIRYFSLTSVFNKGRTTQEAVEALLEVIYLLRGENSLWVPRGSLRQGFGLVLFKNASEDLKSAIKTVYADEFYYEPATPSPVGTPPTQLPYKDKRNEVLLSLLNVFPSGNVDQELSSMFAGLTIMKNQNVSNLVSPFDFMSN